MRILVTGASGLLGGDLCRRLSREHEVTGWSRHPAQAGAGGWKGERVDLTDLPLVRRGVAALAPRLVIHSAAMTDVDGCERDPEAARRINVAATAGLAEACAAVGAVLLAVSTDYVFDGCSPRPYVESDPVAPVSVYGWTKLEGEQAALAVSARTLVVRVSGLFGPARDNFVGMAARRLRAGEEVPAVTDQVNSPSYTVDLAEGMARLVAPLAERPELSEPGGALHGVFHLANRGGASRLEVAQFVAGLVGAPRSLIRKTRWADLNRPARRPAQSEFDCGRFARTVGEQPRDWREAVRAFLSN